MIKDLNAKDTFRLAGLIRNQLMAMYTATNSRYLMSKAKMDRRKLIYQRMFAKDVVNLYKDLQKKVGSPKSLILSARKLYREQTEKQAEDGNNNKEVTKELIDKLKKKTKNINTTELTRTLSVVARETIVPSADELGFDASLDPNWYDDPEDEFENTFPNLYESVNEHSEGIKWSYVAMIALLAAQYGNPSRGESTQELQQLFTNDLNYRTQFYAERAVGNEITEVTAGVEYLVHRDSGTRRRRLITMGDTHVCEICIADSAAGWILVTEPYPSGAFSPPEQHIACRCDEEWEETEVTPPDYIRGA